MKKKVGLIFLFVLVGMATGICQNSVVVTGGTASNSQGYVAGISVGQPYVSSNNGSLFGMQRNYVMKISSISSNPISDVSVALDGNIGEINLNEYFTANEAEELRYSASSSDENVVRVALNGTLLRLTLNQQGSALVTVVAKNSADEQSVLSFIVTVDPPTNPLSINAVEQKNAVSVIGSTILVNNVEGKYVAIYDMAGKCVYSCQNAYSISATIKIPGTYVVRFGKNSQTVIVK